MDSSKSWAGKQSCGERLSKGDSRMNQEAIWDDDVSLLVIYDQKGLFDKSTPIYNAGNLLENINALVDYAHRAGVPVFYVQHANESWLAPGSDGWQLHAGLRPLAADCGIQKRHGS